MEAELTAEASARAEMTEPRVTRDLLMWPPEKKIVSFMVH